MRVNFVRAFFFLSLLLLIGQVSASQIEVTHEVRCDLKDDIIAVETEEGLMGSKWLALRVDEYPDSLVDGEFEYNSSEVKDSRELTIKNRKNDYKYSFYFSGDRNNTRFETKKLDEYGNGTKWIILEKFKPLEESDGFKIRGEIERNLLPYFIEGTDIVCEEGPSSSVINRTFSKKYNRQRKEGNWDHISTAFRKVESEEVWNPLFDISCHRDNYFRGKDFYGYFQDLQSYCSEARTCSGFCSRRPAAISYTTYFSQIASDPVSNPIEASVFTGFFFLAGFLLFRIKNNYSRLKQVSYPLGSAIVLSIPAFLVFNSILVDIFLVLERTFIAFSLFLILFGLIFSKN